MPIGVSIYHKTTDHGNLLLLQSAYTGVYSPIGCTRIRRGLTRSSRQASPEHRLAEARQVGSPLKRSEIRFSSAACANRFILPIPTTVLADYNRFPPCRQARKI